MLLQRFSVAKRRRRQRKSSFTAVSLKYSVWSHYCFTIASLTPFSYLWHIIKQSTLILGQQGGSVGKGACCNLSSTSGHPWWKNQLWTTVHMTHTHIYKINNKSPLFGLELVAQLAGNLPHKHEVPIQSPGLSNLVTHINYLITSVEGPEVQGHPWWHSKFKESLGYLIPCFKMRNNTLLL